MCTAEMSSHIRFKIISSSHFKYRAIKELKGTNMFFCIFAASDVPVLVGVFTLVRPGVIY